MSKRKASKKESPTRQRSRSGRRAKTKGKTLRSYEVGAVPIIDRILRRMRLPEILRESLPPDDPRVELPTCRGLSVLVCNLLVSREPIYGVGEWAARYAPDLLDLRQQEVKLLNDDRIGRCLDRLFDGLDSGLIMAVTRHVVDEFKVSLDELHNDSTTVSFYGAHEDAQQEGRVRGRPTLAITFGHLHSYGDRRRRSSGLQKRFDLTWTLDPVRVAEEEACDGVFPLISNVNEMTAEEILRAYKRQPIIEKRFSHLKTDFSVAPVDLQSVRRIQALLGVYFFVLIVQTLLERELRQAMARDKVESLPLYPEYRACRRPTTRKILDLFEGVQRHELSISGQETEVMVTELSDVQKQILTLLGIPSTTYGR